MKPKSHTLFHFTKNIEFVKNILLDGFWPRYCLEDLSWYIFEYDYIAFPMVCFCDIPLSRIGEHVDFYGEFGIGVTKEWGLANNLNPLSYVAKNSTYCSSVNNLFKNVDYNNGQSGYYEGSGNDLNQLLSFLKPLEGKMLLSGAPVDKEFYQESEWRFVPQQTDVKPWLDKQSYDNATALEQYNKKTKELSSLKISPTDIKYIFVKSDSDIPEIINFIQTKLDNYSGVELKILMSRVVSLESISSDL
ncbi:abortive infection system antitoxin AbiGi family protein [Pseudoalteromonas shioyasakiensis]|uniref:Abortive infection system antitoxin AbiGi family protein n=1 Tax=Pseudoalteromonas shioyasakiensis TaxID=1190813 RepID=A0ABT6TVS7_9GAMM|nr:MULTISPECIES: abortive infection system antitoxin AbiGi family protein [Pseudoalteromonas]MDI4667995.1 abortive infection system antitoxin AbiGi family protein [Pseudoalteromonas shioyasakiensis]MDI4672775.1 abortive infection system antitoxin AbiGi family protein [Pseudoalteromonas shioyasakiensis]MDI4684839.1 abortive infection system antitoxin AbiGi family protein [Pseudoalteromonas shioyasakiensis]MDI4703197.1 abortive infection system antitoxin AbiGi family protein [Pseudoalteromonas sh